MHAENDLFLVRGFVDLAFVWMVEIDLTIVFGHRNGNRFILVFYVPLARGVLSRINS